MSDASFLGFIEGNLLVVDQVFDGEILIGLALYGGGVVPGTIVTDYGTGSGGAGTYVVDKNQTASGPQFYQNSLPSPVVSSGTISIAASAPASDETGPDYPRVNVIAGENAIGKLKIGVSQVGDIPIFDLWSTVLSQYANSPTIMGLIEAWDGGLDQTRNFDAFFDDVWNVDTAWGYGLDVWGRIVGITRVLQLSDVPMFGFAESAAAGTPNVVGFNQGMFFTGINSTENYRLDDETFRRLIIGKAMSNITDDSIPSINRILMMLFPYRGNAWVSDNPTAQYFGFLEAGASSGVLGFNQGEFYTGETLPHMQMTYNFAFPLTPIDFAIIYSGVLPKPVGVLASVNSY